MVLGWVQGKAKGTVDVATDVTDFLTEPVNANNSPLDDEIKGLWQTTDPVADRLGLPSPSLAIAEQEGKFDVGDEIAENARERMEERRQSDTYQDVRDSVNDPDPSTGGKLKLAAIAAIILVGVSLIWS